MADDLPPLREVIREHGLSARKSFGQNFLFDLNLTAKIARQAGDLTGHDILEVGPGPGGLTRGLLEEGARRVVAAELDRRCIPALDDIATAYLGRLQVVEADALSGTVEQHLNPPVKIVSNLPYNIGTELFVRWLNPDGWPEFWDSMTLMFQREVAERIVASPGSKAYGRLSILAQWRCEVRIAMTVPPSAFTPPPKVHSAVIVAHRRAAPPYPADPRVLSRVVAAAFNQRRKMLRASLKSLHPRIEAILQNAQLDPTKRAENLSLEEYCRLARALA